MLKLKTHKATKKRYKITKKNKIVASHAFKSHLLNKKSKKSKRKLSKNFLINKCNKTVIKLMLPYSLK